MNRKYPIDRPFSTGDYGKRDCAFVASLSDLPKNFVYYVYVLKSIRDRNYYVGQTSNVEERVKLHNSGKVKSTKHRKPFVLVYYEACLSRKDSVKRELYLKTAWGKRYIKNRLKETVKLIRDPVR